MEGERQQGGRKKGVKGGMQQGGRWTVTIPSNKHSQLLLNKALSLKCRAM